MLAAISIVGPLYMAVMLATGIRLGRKFKRLNAELDRFGTAEPL